MKPPITTKHMFKNIVLISGYSVRHHNRKAPYLSLHFIVFIINNAYCQIEEIGMLRLK